MLPQLIQLKKQLVYMFLPEHLLLIIWGIDLGPLIILLTY